MDWRLEGKCQEYLFVDVQMLGFIERAGVLR